MVVEKTVESFLSTPDLFELFMRYSFEAVFSTDLRIWLRLVRTFYSFRALYGFVEVNGEAGSLRFKRFLEVETSLPPAICYYNFSCFN